MNERGETFAEMKTGTLIIAGITKGYHLKYYKNEKLDHATSFYITNVSNEIISVEHKQVQPGTFYLLEPQQLDSLNLAGNVKIEKIDSLIVSQKNHMIYPALCH